MNFRIRYYPDCYEELITYYPKFYREVREMVAVLHAHGRMADALMDNIDLAYSNSFIMAADERTIKKWEKFLNITYDKELTLDQRRRVVAARISGYGHIGEPEIRELVGIYTDCDITVDFAAGVIYVNIDGEIFDEGNLYETLLDRIPAHLALKMTARTIRRFPITLNFGFGAAIGKEARIEPVPRGRTIKEPVTVSAGAYAYTRAPTHQAPVKHKTGSQARSSGGLYCRTHIKSKLVKEE